MTKPYALVLILCSFMSSSVFANQFLNLPTQEIVRANLWHQGIEQPNTVENNSFDAAVNYPEELVVAIELLDLEKR